MDGTLVDSSAAVVAQWGRWAVRHNVPLADILAVSHGRPALETMRRFRPEVATEEEHQRFMAEEESYETGVKAIAGAVDFVTALPSDRWAVVTSAPRTLAEKRLAAAGFPPAPVLIAPEDVVHGKPDPEPYRIAAQRLGVAPGDCVSVEDSHAGIDSAMAAGTQVIAIETMYKAEDLHAEHAIRDFTQLRLVRGRDEICLRIED